LCYFSRRRHQRVKLVSPTALSAAQITKADCAFYPNTLRLQVDGSYQGDEAGLELYLAARCEDDLLAWNGELQNAWQRHSLHTLQLGVQDKCDHLITTCTLDVVNRRNPVEVTVPVHHGVLWKLKVGGDPVKADDWRKRLCYCDKSGALVYWSPHENRDLAYLSPGDLVGSTITCLAPGSTARRYAFAVVDRTLQRRPAFFSAKSKSARDAWIANLSGASSRR